MTLHAALQKTAVNFSPRAQVDLHVTQVNQVFPRRYFAFIINLLSLLHVFRGFILDLDYIVEHHYIFFITNRCLKRFSQCDYHVNFRTIFN